MAGGFPVSLESSIMLIDTLRSAVPIIFSVLFGIGIFSVHIISVSKFILY